MDEKNKENIEKLKKENELLKEQLEQYEKKSDQFYSTFEWAKILNQAEIDSVVKNRIAQDMLSYYMNSELSLIKVIEDTLDCALKDINIESMPNKLKKSLSLGLQTTDVLAGSIFLFLTLAKKMVEKEPAFMFDDYDDEYDDYD